jgi:hypothetical protein
VRNVITAENDTNLVRRMTANLTNESVQLKARHSTSQQTPYVAFFLPGDRDSGLADYSSTPAFVNLGRYVTQPKRLLPRPLAELSSKVDTRLAGRAVVARAPHFALRKACQRWDLLGDVLARRVPVSSFWR